MHSQSNHRVSTSSSHQPLVAAIPRKQSSSGRTRVCNSVGFKQTDPTDFHKFSLWVHCTQLRWHLKSARKDTVITQCFCRVNPFILSRNQQKKAPQKPQKQKRQQQGQGAARCPCYRAGYYRRPRLDSQHPRGQKAASHWATITKPEALLSCATRATRRAMSLLLLFCFCGFFGCVTRRAAVLRNPGVFCVDTCTRDPLGWPSSSSELVALGRLFLQLLSLVSNKHLISLSDRVAGASSHELLRGVDPQVAERLGAGHGVHCHLFGA